jgi:hypothetical protein
MGEPTQKKGIKLTPGNRKQKGRRSLPKDRQIGKDREKIAYRFKDPRVGEMDVLNSANGWWAEGEGHRDGNVKLQKLVDAYCFYMTDEEACSYANITKDQLEYFQKLHPDFYGIKHASKSQPDMHAKKKIVGEIQKNVEVAKWWIERTQKDTFSTRSENTGANGRDLYDGLTERFKQLTEKLSDGAEIKKEEYPNLFGADNDDAGPNGDGHEAEATAPTGEGDTVATD